MGTEKLEQAIGHCPPAQENRLAQCSRLFCRLQCIGTLAKIKDTAYYNQLTQLLQGSLGPVLPPSVKPAVSLLYA